MIAAFAPAIPPALCIAAGILAAVAQVWFWKRTALRGLPRSAALTLRLGAIALLAWILSAPQRPILETAEDRPAVVLTDISRSMDFPAENGTRADTARRVVERLTGKSPRSVKTMSFGARLLAAGVPPVKDPVRQASLPAAALREILTTGGNKSLPHSILLISDGAAQDAEDLVRVAKAMRSRGVPVSVLCTGGEVSVKNAALLTLDAERRVKAGTVVPVSITTQQTGCDEPLIVELFGDDGKVVDRATMPAGGPAEQTATLHVTTSANGFSGKVRIAALENEITLTDNEAPVIIGTDNAILRVLYMEGSTSNNFGVPEPCFLPQALAASGDIEVDLLCPTLQGGAALVGWPWKSGGTFRPDASKGYPRTKEELNRYDVVICSDIPRQAFSSEQIQWTVELVAERGGGFIMVGGVTSFGSGYWDRTPWELMIPVDMDDLSRGSNPGYFSPFWPTEGKRHPLLAQLPLQSGEKLDDILNAHPHFNGTNMVRRAKPAATVLMTIGDASGQPLIAVQPYGKGRTMAFTSDITWQWGTEHRGDWGPPEGTVKTPQGTFRDGFAASANPQFNNSYYRRFWQRSIRWLAENSIRVKGSQFEATTPFLSWPAQAALPINAAGPDESMMTRLSGVPCMAQVRGMAGTRTRLKWDAAARRFSGSILRPAGLPEEVTVDVEVKDPLQREPRTASFTVRAPRVDPESAAPSARPDLLAAVAEASGGRVLHTAGEAAAWLDERTSTVNAPERTGRMPAWDRTWVLTAVLAILAADWLIRRFHS